MEHFVQPLDFMISGAKINSLTANGSDIKEFITLNNNTVWKTLLLQSIQWSLLHHAVESNQ